MRYTVLDAAKIVGLTSAQVRSFARAGVLAPERGARREMRLSFQDLLVLRAAKGLLRAGIPAARVRRSLQRLRSQLPDGQPLTGVRIMADGKRVLASDGSSIWNPESGQALLSFHVSDLAREVAPLVREATAKGRGVERELAADDFYELGYDLEAVDPEQARDAYRRAIELDPQHVDSHVNLGRLLHEAGEVNAAAAHYRLALSVQPQDVTAVFNLAVALSDLGRLEEAVDSYEKVIRLDPTYADAYYNIASLYQRLGKKAAALRFLKTYRKLTKGS